ncbi:MAG: chemotaxis response regulator protein-glutamate methylesterase [Cellvibrionaceae bacterium]|nr:chemotaxis response regulator protein-glutamate methylesterase [Cellvibrionaceae bacterium]
MKKITVLIIDDSALIRKLLKEIIDNDPQLEVVGMAVDPYDAREKIKQLNPDVITLDIEMPKMDGITFLKNVMRLRPMPVVMISTLTEKGASITIQALEIGAIDYIAKPKVAAAEELPKLAADITGKIRLAARANMSLAGGALAKTQQVPAPVAPTATSRVSVIAIGASTGGVEATKWLLKDLPDAMPPIVIVQHMPGTFTTSYAKRLDALLPLTVIEFEGAEKPLEKNHVYIANGNQHFCVKGRGHRLVGYCVDAEPVNRHKPAVDVLFESVANTVNKDAIAILLTGMGVDGAAGMGKIKAAGALTIAQDQQSSVVWGMPRVAIEQGAADHILPLDKIAAFTVKQCYG